MCIQSGSALHLYGYAALALLRLEFGVLIMSLEMVLMVVSLALVGGSLAALAFSRS